MSVSAHSRTRRGLLVPTLGCLIITFLASGCATTSGWYFADEPGVPVDMRLEGDETLSATLVELSNGTLVIDTSIERGEDVEVIRRGGVDYVYVRGVAAGTAVEIRDFDIVTRQRVPLCEADDLTVRSRGYLGWGSAVAGVLTFFLLRVVEDSQ